MSDPQTVAASTVVPSQDLPALERDLAALFVQALNLELKAEEIGPTTPLFGEGLGLDSIDILEVALEVSQRYGFQLRSDDENNHQIFQNLRSLAAHVAQHRTQERCACDARWLAHRGGWRRPGRLRTAVAPADGARGA